MEDFVKNDILLGVIEDNIEEMTEVFEAIKIGDNMSNIENVLLVEKNAYIKSIGIKGSSYVLNGVLRVCICYFGENGSLDSITKDIPFEQVISNSDKKGEIFNVSLSVVSFDWQVVKKRRVEITCDVKITGIGIINENAAVISEENLPLEAKRGSNSYSIFDTTFTKENYKFKKEIPLEDDIKICYINAKLMDEQSNASGVGVLYNANVAVDMIYMVGVDEEAEYKTEKLIFPINHFIEKNPNLKCTFYDINANVKDIDGVYYSDTEDSYIEIVFDLCCNTIFGEERCVDVISDAYSTDEKIEPLMKNYMCSYLDKSFNENISVSDTINLSKFTASDVIAHAEDVEYNIFDSDGRITVEGKLYFQFVCIVKEEEGFLSESGQIPFRLELDEMLDLSSSYVHVSVDSIDFENINGKMKIDATLNIKGYEIEQKEFCELYGVNEIEIPSSENSLKTIRVYYKEADESLWDICKKNHVSVESVLKVNDYESEDDIMPLTPLVIR